MATSLIVADAMRSLSLGGWLVPWPGTRGTVVLHSVVELIIEQALTYGHVDVLQQTTAQTPDGGIPVGAALWVHCPGEAPPVRPADYGRRLTKAAGSWASRFRAMDALLDPLHPSEPHHHLTMLAVDVAQQGTGVEDALLREHNAVLETAALVGFAVAWDKQQHHLLKTHRFQCKGSAATLTEGIIALPMQRRPLGEKTPTTDRFTPAPRISAPASQTPIPLT